MSHYKIVVLMPAKDAAHAKEKVMNELRDYDVFLGGEIESVKLLDMVEAVQVRQMQANDKAERAYSLSKILEQVATVGIDAVLEDNTMLHAAHVVGQYAGNHVSVYADGFSGLKTASDLDIWMNYTYPGYFMFAVYVDARA